MRETRTEGKRRLLYPSRIIPIKLFPLGVSHAKEDSATLKKYHQKKSTTNRSLWWILINT
jgi:hypothetical protein